MEVDTEGKAKRRPRLAYILVPLLIIAMALTGWMLFQGRSPVDEQPQATAVLVTARPQPAPVDVPGDGAGMISGPATPWAVAGGPGEILTQETTGAVVIVEATPIAIALQGPPGGSFFRQRDVVAFYWSSPEAPVPSQRFIVYLVVSGERIPLGVVDEANLGQSYQLQAEPGRISGEAGNYSWLVVLEDEASGTIIGESERRSLSIVDDN